jgi:L-serine deaminase
MSNGRWLRLSSIKSFEVMMAGDGTWAICGTVCGTVTSQYMYKKGFKSEEEAQRHLDALIEKAAMSWQWRRSDENN